jgi:hypothetical protein
MRSFQSDSKVNRDSVQLVFVQRPVRSGRGGFVMIALNLPT